MKNYVKVLLCVISMILLPGLSVYAQETDIVKEEYKEDVGQSDDLTETFLLDEVSYINPLYENLQPEILPEPGISLYEEENPVYLTTVEEVTDIMRDAMEARAPNITVYYSSTEWLMEDSNWINTWLDSIYTETDQPTEGDYLRLHVHKVRFCGGTASKKNGVYYYPLPFEFTYLSDYEQEEAVTEKVNALMKEFAFTDDTVTIQKIRTIYDWVCENVTYDNVHDSAYTLKHSAYAAAIDGTSVCQGYASLMYRLMRESGLSVRVITGESNGVGHAWNIVKLGDYYYNLDATWDAGLPSYNYFMKCESNFINHIRNEEYAADAFYEAYPMADSDYREPGEDDENKETEESETVIPLPVDIKTLMIDKISDQEFTGETIEPKVVISDEGYVLVQDKDYTLNYENNTNKGTAKITITGIGEDYCGEVITTFAIVHTKHEYDEGVVTKKPTYQSEGSKRYTCAICKGIRTEKIEKLIPKNYEDDVEAFVARLYVECLNREPEEAGLKDWTQRLKSKELSGITAASGIVFSQEFKNRNLCNEDYVELLYRAFMGREYDSGGKSYWMQKLLSGVTREEVFNGFALSAEFGNICNEYVIKQGKGISIPTYGTIPTGVCSLCGEEDGVTAFVKRLYKICLNREADESGLKDWTGQLWTYTNSGRGVAFGFIFSPEFVNKNHSNSDYVEYLYQAFMGRASDEAGKKDWINRLTDLGWSREQVFDGFVYSNEFTNICHQYSILRD